MQKQSLLSLAIFLGVCGTTMAQGQQPTASSQLIQINGSESGMTATTLFKKYFHLQASDALRPLRKEQDALGFSHEKYRQYYCNVVVENATVTVHSKAGQVVSLSGNYSPVSNLNVKPAITAATAFQAAKAHVGAKHYRWEDPQNEHNTYQMPKGELVVLPDFSGKTPTRLAYKFDIYASEPLYRAYVYIDAQTGKYLRENKRIHDVDLPATGVSLYDGNVSFTAQSFTDVYRLRQATTGGGVETYNLHNGTSYGSATDFTSLSTSFTADHAGVEAHWCTEKTYNYYLTKLGRHSYDDADGVLKSYVHYGNNYVNAFWDGNAMTYGDGDGSHSPLVTLDICGHEITHGVTEHSANLIYDGESGALNESFSDIFGESIENYGKGANNWLVGSEIGEIIRDMSNPNVDGSSPDTYHGTYWFDYNDVHYNSGVQNKWFYIMTVGETGTNDLNDHYCVTGLGITKAAAIAYRNLTVYLSASSNYPAARNGAIQAAIDLYGANSPEVVSTTNAWHAVGVGAAFVPKITCPANIVLNNTPNLCSAVATYTAPVGIGNCPGTTRTTGGASGTAFPVGTTTVTYKVTDTDMATGTCAFTVQVNDTQAPAITCPANTTVAASVGCQAPVGNYTALALATDNCTAPTVSQTPVPGTNISGTTTLTLRATDVGNLTASCTMTVSVLDNTAPTISCPANVTVAANAACQASLASYTGSAAAADNCSTPTVSQLPVSGTIINAGTTTVTLRATDASSLTATCAITVTVTDQTPPTITCPANTTVAADATCQSTLASYVAGTTASDNCSTPTKTQLPVSGTSLALGTTTVTMRATDGVALSTSCTFTVTVTDQTAPTVVCKAATVILSAAGTASITTAGVFQSATDNCGIINQVMVTPSTFTCSNVGLNNVVLTVNDGHGNNGTCTAQVTVVDNMAPSMLCKNATINLNAAGSATVTTAQINNGSSDNCAIATLTLSKTTFSCANIGANTVTLTGTDLSNNAASCQATVTVVDAIAPVAVCKNATVQLNAAGTVTVPGATINNGSSDNCTFNLSLTPGTFNCGNVGTNTVVMKATDAGGNTATCTAIVTVQDKIAPSALCKNINVFLDNDGQASITAAQVNNGSSDACGIATASINITNFNCSNLPGSPVAVQLLLKDIYNNQSSCLAYVTVKELLTPVAICQDVTVQLSAQGNVTVYPANLAADSYDNCSVWSYSPVAKVYTTANVGLNNLTITVKDFSNNASTCVSKVTVQPYNSNNNLVDNRGGSSGVFAGTTDLRLYPNPSDGQLTVDFRLPQDETVQLRLFDLTGKLVMQQSMDAFQNDNTLHLDLGKLPAGLYMVDLQSGTQREQKRLVIER